jgi:hypothetical protein
MRERGVGGVDKERERGEWIRMREWVNFLR